MLPPSEPLRPATRQASSTWQPAAACCRLLAPLTFLTLGLAVLGCAENDASTSLPELPTESHGDSSWFWRDVLSGPMPGEARPLTRILGLDRVADVIDGLAELAATNDPAALTTLMAALRDKRIAVACAAAHELGVHGHRAAIPRLIKSLGPYPVDYDVPPEVRAACASALARLGNPSGIPLVLTMLAEDTPDEVSRDLLPWTATTRMAFIQELALEGLTAMAGTDFGFDPNGSVPARRAAAAAARAWWEQRRLVLWADTAPLADEGLVTRARLLVHHLRAYQLRQIDGARFTLAALGPGVLPLLRTALDSDDDYRPLHALQVMRRLTRRADRKTRGRLAIVAAGPLLSNPSVAIASQAAAVCGAAGIPDPLVNALARRNEPGVLLAVVDALGSTGHPDMAAVLDEWLAERDQATSPDLAAAFEAAQLQLDAEHSPEGLLALLGSADPNVVFPAVERLIRLTGGDQGLDPLGPAADRDQALRSAREALLARHAPGDG